MYDMHVIVTIPCVFLNAILLLHNLLFTFKAYGFSLDTHQCLASLLIAVFLSLLMFVKLCQNCFNGFAKLVISKVFTVHVSNVLCVHRLCVADYNT